MIVPLLLTLLVSANGSVIGSDESEIDVKNSPYYKNGIFTVPMSEESGNELYQHWVDQAFSSLMAALATERLPKVSSVEKERHYKCAKRADDVQTHAKCVSMLLEADAEQAKRNRWAKLLGKRRVANRILRRKPGSYSFRKPRISARKAVKRSSKKKKLPWVGGFRVVRRKREVINRNGYNLIDGRDRSFFGQIAKHLTKTVRVLKNKKIHRNRFLRWQEVIMDIKKEADGMDQKRREKEMLKKRLKFYSRAAVNYGRTARKHGKLRKLMKLHELEKALEPEHYSQKDYMEKEYRKRQKKLTSVERAVAEPVKLVREGVKLAMMVAGQNVTDFEEKSLRMISPRMMSLIPDDAASSGSEVNVLSPSLFSLHDKGRGIEKMTSFTSLLNSTGLLKDSDQQEWMDFIIETSGAADALDEAKVKKEKEVAKTDVKKIRGPDGQPIYLTKQNVTKIYGRHEASKIELFERLQKSFTQEQLSQMNRTGYTVLSPSQRKLVYGESSPYNNSVALEAMQNVTDDVAHRTMRDTVRHVAAGRLRYEARRGVVSLAPVTPAKPRQKRAIVLSPLSNVIILNDPVTVSQPLILSPVQFSALINSPAIFGVIVLSPWLFIPVVLSPRIFSPVILSAFAFVPIILTPLAFVPVILSPGVMNPFILSPLIFSPFILSPQAMTPLILSPFALSPFIATPNVLSPIILSPFVLSPIILSPAYVSALVLSPYAFSPVINSTGAIFTSVASPSWLS